MVRLARERRQDGTRKAMVAEGNETLTRTVGERSTCTLSKNEKEIAATENFLSTRYGMTKHQVQDAIIVQIWSSHGRDASASNPHMENIATAQQTRLQARRKGPHTDSAQPTAQPTTGLIGVYNKQRAFNQLGKDTS